MPERPEYAALVAQAEEAVKSMRDPDLKRVAFQKVLDDLLSSSSGPQRRKPLKPRTPGQEPERPARGGPQAYVGEMAADGFFKKPKTIAQVKAELADRGHHIPLTSLSGPLQKLCQQRVLRRHKTIGSGKKQVFTYTEW